MEKKQWKSLHLINKKTFFLGLQPVQWVLVSCILFMAGWFAWWLSVALLIPLTMICRRIARMVSAGNPDPVAAIIVWLSMKKYFIDRHRIFDILSNRKNEG